MSFRRFLASIVVLAALVRGAPAQTVTPPPLTATLINFDDMQCPIDIVGLLPVTGEYTDRGITFSGFGLNGGACFGTGEGIDNVAISPPNFMIFSARSRWPTAVCRSRPRR